MAAQGPARRRQRTAGRARPTVQRASLPLLLPVQPSAAECAALLKALIKHLLFQRAQIPYLYDELLMAAHKQQCVEAAAEAAEAAAGGSRRRRRRCPKGDKRLLKFLCKAEELLASIDAALAAFGVPRRAFLLLGSSSTKPREVFEVHLPQPAILPHGSTATTPPAASCPQHQRQGAAVHGAAVVGQGSQARLTRQQRLCQLAVRQLVVGGAELPEGMAHTVPCKLFVLLEGPPAATAGAADQPDTAAEAAAVAVPAGFSTKRQFRLTMRKGTHVRLLLGQRAAEEQERQQEQLAAEQRERQAAESMAPASSEASMQDGSCSSCCAAEGQAGTVTVHHSQLPDADGQGQAARLGQPASSTAGSVWFMARAVLKGLNSGGGGAGVAAGFDGL